MEPTGRRGPGTAVWLPVIGFLSTRSPDEAAIHTNAFRRGLEEMGYAEGRGVVVEYRWASGTIASCGLLPPT